MEAAMTTVPIAGGGLCRSIRFESSEAPLPDGGQPSTPKIATVGIPLLQQQHGAVAETRRWLAAEAVRRRQAAKDCRAGSEETRPGGAAVTEWPEAIKARSAPLA